MNCGGTPHPHEKTPRNSCDNGVREMGAAWFERPRTTVEEECPCDPKPRYFCFFCWWRPHWRWPAPPGLRRFAARGGAVIVATHDVELAAALATRAVLLAGGEVIADGPPAEVLADSPVFSPEMTRVFGPGWLTPEQVARALGA